MDSRTDVWLNESNIWEYIELHRGGQRQPLVAAILLTVVNSIIFITGITGNVGVCIVIHKNHMLHSATHYFLFNLAVADLLLLIFGLPNDVALYWHQYPWIFGVFFCKLRGLISEMASYVSVMTIVVFSTERYLAICHPLHIHTMAGLSRAIKVIAALWFIAFIAALPFYHLTEVHYVNYPNSSENIPIEESAFCGMMEQPEHFPLIQISFGIFFVFPLIVILTQYIKMSSSIANSEKPLNGISGSINENRLRRRAQSNKSIVRMLLAVVVGFFCCWAPFHAQRLVVIYAPNWNYIDEFNFWMFFATGIFYYFSSTLNPILYNIMSKKMRSAFKDTFGGLCWCFELKKTSRSSDLSNSFINRRKSRSITEESQYFVNRTSMKNKESNDVRNHRKSEFYNLNNDARNVESVV